MGESDEREAAVFERSVGLFRAANPAMPVGDGSWSARDVLGHLLHQRLNPDAAADGGLTVDGDPGALARLVGCLEQP